MDDLRVADALDAIFDIFRKCNKYIDETKPWLLAKDENNKDRLATVLYNLVESIRHGAAERARPDLGLIAGFEGDAERLAWSIRWK